MGYGIPVRNGNHLLLDFATASMSTGQIRERVAKGEELPPGVLVDQKGTPRTKPQQGENRTMTLPFGGYKGGGLQLITEVLGGVLIAPPSSPMPKDGRNVADAARRCEWPLGRSLARP